MTSDTDKANAGACDSPQCCVLLQGLAEGVCLCGGDGRIFYANPAMERMFGYAAGEMTGMDQRQLLAPSEQKTSLEIGQEIARQFKADGAWSGQSQSLRKDSSRFWCRLHISTFHHPGHGEVLVSVREDITEQHQMEERLRRINQELQRLAHTDMTTSLPNRRSFIDTLMRELERQHRYGGYMSLALVDVDHFKDINDASGHAAGDQVLADLANLLRCELRLTDVVARWGGDEFTVLMPGTALQSGIDTIDRLRKKIMALTVTSGGQTVQFTVSAGVVWAGDQNSTSVVDMLRRADEALYVAKAAGRNRVATTALPTEPVGS